MENDLKITRLRGKLCKKASVENKIVDLAGVKSIQTYEHCFKDENGQEHRVSWQWASDRPILAKEFLAVMHEFSETNVICGLSSAKMYQGWVRPFFKWLKSDTELEKIGIDSPLTPKIFTQYKIYLDSRTKLGLLQSKTAYAYKGAVLRLIRHIVSQGKQSIISLWKDADFIMDSFEEYKPRDPYTPQECKRIINHIEAFLRSKNVDNNIKESLIYTGLALRLGIETECLDRLKIGSIELIEGQNRLRIRYQKRRSPSKPNRVRLVNSLETSEKNDITAETGSLKTAGALIAYQLSMRLGEPKDSSLWTSKPNQYWFTKLTEVLYNEGLRDDKGGKLILNRTRFRVSYKTSKMISTQGKLSVVADDHSNDVAAKHYLENSFLKPLYEQAVENAALEALDYALQKPSITNLKEDALAEEIETESKVKRVPVDALKKALSGETDVWLASCRDFYNSPFDPKGNPCTKSFWGCFGCENALITRRSLPGILSFLDHTVSQRALLSENDWTKKFGHAYSQITQHILPSFNYEVIEEARAISKGLSAFHFPPELQG